MVKTETFEDMVARHGMTQEGLAKYVGIARTTLRNWTRGLTKPTRPNLSVVAAALTEKPPDVLKALAASAKKHRWAA